MEPSVKSAFDEILKRLDGIDERWERRFSVVEGTVERNHQDVVARVSTLEQHSGIHAESLRAADGWMGHFDSRVVDLEKQMGEVELIRFAEICDERDLRVAALEDAVTALNNWKPNVDGVLDTMRTETKRLSQHWDRAVR
jgi:hypothetical protein